MVKWNNHRYCHVFLTDFHRNVPIGLLRHSDFRIEWRRIFLEENQKKKMPLRLPPFSSWNL